MSKENPQPKKEEATGKVKPKAKRLTVKAVWSEVDALKQSLSALGAKTTSLNESYSKQTEEISNLRQSLVDNGSKMDSLIASTKSAEETYGKMSTKVDTLKESVDKLKKDEEFQPSLDRLEGALKKGYWFTGLAMGAIVIVVIVAAILLR